MKNMVNNIDVYEKIAGEIEAYAYGDIRRVVLSISKSEVQRVNIRPITLKGGRFWQFESIAADQAFHENVPAGAFRSRLVSYLSERGFRAVNVMLEGAAVHYRITKKGKLLRSADTAPGGDGAPRCDSPSVRVGTHASDSAPARDGRLEHDDAAMRARTHASDSAPEFSHDRQKSYILPEGTPIRPFVDLGVFDKNYRIIKSKYDTFRQVNRFIGIIADNKDEMIRIAELRRAARSCVSVDVTESDADNDIPQPPAGPEAPNNIPLTGSDNESPCPPARSGAGVQAASGFDLTVVDFGCGKSYLTFFLYHYLTDTLKLKIRMYGFDLKKDVVARCNEIAARYGYNGLGFHAGDAASLMDELPDGADMLITLHACDTATDDALYYAISKRVPLVFSVPCCQHEVNAQLTKRGVSEGARDKTNGCVSTNAEEFSLMLRHGLYRERFSALLTDSIRCEVLKDMGYTVDVVEFVDFENTPKNAMIRAELNSALNNVIKPHQNPELTKLLSMFGVSQKLVDLVYK